jgi:hypothetical protein
LSFLSAANKDSPVYKFLEGGAIKANRAEMDYATADDIHESIFASIPGESI